MEEKLTAILDEVSQIKHFITRPRWIMGKPEKAPDSEGSVLAAFILGVLVASFVAWLI